MTEFVTSLFRIARHARVQSTAECSMTEHIIQDWLADYAALSPVEVHSFANNLKHNDEVITALYAVLEERNKFSNLVDPVCNQLFGFYRSREVELQRFTLQFLPTLIYIYLNSVAHGDKKSCRSVETLLIGVFNLEVVDEKGEPVVISFRLPSLAQASIYHEPMSLAHASLTETALRRLEECNTKLVTWGPLSQVEMLNAQNRLKIMTALMFIYNKHIGLLHKTSLNFLCKVTSRLVTQGFPRPGQHQRTSSYGSDGSFVPKFLPRIPVSSQLLLEFMCGLYYAMYNDFGYMAMQSVDDIYNRSCYECYADVVLVANAIKNSSHGTSTGHPSEGPMGISVALSPATTTVTTVNKSMITNASFRTKKLPDDLDVECFATCPPPRRPSLGNDVASTPEAEPQKTSRKGKWKGLNWLHNATNRASIEEEEEPPSVPRRKSIAKSAQTSPVSNKKPSSRRNSADVQMKHRNDDFVASSVPPFGSDSPKRRALVLVNSSSPNRMSAGARLCKVFEEDTFSFDSGDFDEKSLQKLYVSGRPSSLNLTAMKQV